MQHEEQILAGTFHGPLIQHIPQLLDDAYRHCSKVAFKRIYRSKEVLDVEIAGYQIIRFILKALIEAVEKPNNEYSKILLNRIPEQYEVDAETCYERILAVLDFVSGMTDVYALDLYRKITGMSLPAV